MDGAHLVNLASQANFINRSASHCALHATDRPYQIVKNFGESTTMVLSKISPNRKHQVLNAFCANITPINAASRTSYLRPDFRQYMENKYVPPRPDERIVKISGLDGLGYEIIGSH